MIAARRIYGLLAEFDNPTDLVHAVRQAREAGYRRLDAYTPYPIEELSDALEFRRTRMPLVILIGGAIGCLSGYLLQYYCAAWDYPLAKASLTRMVKVTTQRGDPDKEGSHPAKSF